MSLSKLGCKGDNCGVWETMYSAVNTKCEFMKDECDSLMLSGKKNGWMLMKLWMLSGKKGDDVNVQLREK